MSARAQIIGGDCRDILPTLPECHFDAVVTDPPYELGFMGKKWDSSGVAFDVETWRAVRRVAKPGAHLLAMGGTRTFHRLACAIEDAGWEIRDCIMWVYGMGFPKSHDVSKAMDKAAGHWRGRAGAKKHWIRNAAYGQHYLRTPKGEPVTAAAAWSGYGTGLKPAWEPVIVARNPVRGTIAGNCLEFGCGAINVDGCRIPTEPADQEAQRRVVHFDRSYSSGERSTSLSGAADGSLHRRRRADFDPGKGRWPANLIHDGSEEATAPFSGTEKLSRCGERSKGADDYGPGSSNQTYGKFKSHRRNRIERHFDDYGSAARFFYCAKARAADRKYGMPDGDPTKHPTLKPLALARYLVRLISPPGGARILDPFAGSGTFGIAAMEEGAAEFVGIDLEPEDAARRVAFAEREA